ncbi:P-type ATPase [Rhizina undulata]
MQTCGQGFHPRSGEGSVHDLQLSSDAYLLTYHEIITQLKTDRDNGLSVEEAKSRLTQFGPNEIAGGGGVSATRILVRQIFNAMVLVLIMAMVASFAIKSWIEAGVVSAVVVTNIVVGFFQEYSAEKTMDSLRSLSSPTASVIRSGHYKIVPSQEVVPGDIIEVKTGDTIPADMRLFEAMNMSTPPEDTNEALLTGESLPVAKNAEASFKELNHTGIGDRINMAYSSSTVTKGRAKAIVACTGMKTEIGKIAESLQGGDRKAHKVRRNDDGHDKLHRYVEAGALTVGDQIGKFLGVSVGTPLQRKLSWLAIFLFFIAVIFAIICLAANNFSNNAEVILYAVG